ncbi:C6 finger domain protein, putative [Cordyceps militaris CM01]|uniref:C6 finger domain protein, putative n=1 Tax=Cordyceps militaris (strain CM01) TaxID=983644 RepID=G3J5F6_CORMM|nr:C6 finger domain protein, putative [Cordyceps militaris CM01]EGX96017.1 C6 finger domain protein, putative [Cordyceps militaris CM01]
MSSKPATDGSRRGSRGKPKSPKQQVTVAAGPNAAAAVTKKRYSKTKLGCKTCKVRKIRCDETSPVCNNCTKSGRRCDGVAEPVNKDGGLTFTAPLTLTHFRPTQTGWLTPQEIAHLDLFRHELVYSIVGHVGTPSWKRLILQAVHEEVALCHAVVAFTALSTSAAGSLLPGDGGSDSGGQGVAVSGAQSPLSHHASRENEFALRHYGKALEAMRHVFRHNDKRSINTALLCTLLCICFELRIKEPATALTHLEHGLQVVSSNLHTVDEAITTAFARLDLQAAIFLGIRPPALDPSRVASRIFVFDSVYQEADHALAGLTNRVWTFIRTVAADYRYEELGPVPDAVAAQAQSIRKSLDGFHAQYLTPGSKLDKMLPEQTSLLRIKHLTSVVIMSGCLSPEETVYDAHAADFVAMVDLAADIRARQQQLIPNYAAGSGGGGGFQLDMAVIHPLYLTATKCRCPVTRRRAVHALYTGPEFEGAWEGVVNARIGERVMQMEEEGLVFDLHRLQDGELLDVPEHMRVHSVDICTEPAQGRATVYFSRRPNGPGSEWDDLQEEMVW